MNPLCRGERVPPRIVEEGKVGTLGRPLEVLDKPGAVVAEVEGASSISPIAGEMASNAGPCMLDEIGHRVRICVGGDDHRADRLRASDGDHCPTRSPRRGGRGPPGHNAPDGWRA